MHETFFQLQAVAERHADRVPAHRLQDSGSSSMLVLRGMHPDGRGMDGGGS